MLGQPYLQRLQMDDLIFEIQKYTTLLMNNLYHLKKNKIEEIVVEINNLCGEFLNGKDI